ncbi:2%2C3-cyclic-nucleotide 2-phosphodiesterase [Staphylococcus aureus]|nr:2%2C3-cyclic-nucleotide 2-phosphodiesterase [Staphylococcus aureus]
MEQDVSIEKTLVASKRWIRYIHEVEEPDFFDCNLSWWIE